jgi:hypothetical protein
VVGGGCWVLSAWCLLQRVQFRVEKYAAIQRAIMWEWRSKRDLFESLFKFRPEFIQYEVRKRGFITEASLRELIALLVRTRRTTNGLIRHLKTTEAPKPFQHK